jgi:hypothetical protein
MTTLNTVPRSVRRETDERRDHLEIFREFLHHLGRASRGQNDDTATPIDRRGRK